MDWLIANWVWILIAIAFVAMHMFGHGGHGGHGSHVGDDERTRGQPARRPEANLPAGHQH